MLEREKLVNQLALRSWTTEADTIVAQQLLTKARAHIFTDRKRQTLMTDFKSPSQ